MVLTKDYFEKTKKHIEEYGELTIVLIQVGVFFEVYGLKDNNNTICGSNILEFSRICDLNIADKKTCCGQDSLVMAGFKDHLLDRYIKKLQEAGYTIVVYEQDEPGTNTTRSLTGVYSPGTYFLLETEKINNHTCCIWIESKNSFNKLTNYVYIGASVIDIFTGKTNLMEYKEIYLKNPCTFDDLERFISIYNPSETILITNLSNSELDDIVSFTNIKSKSIHSVFLNNEFTNTNNYKRALNCEKQTYQKELLNKFYKILDFPSFISVFNENVYATQSFCYLLDFIYQHNPNLIYKISEPLLESSNKKLILANHSLKQLNIIDDSDRDYSGKYSSVVKMLNECITPMGKRQFSNNFLIPVTDEKYLKSEYDIIEKILLYNEEKKEMNDYKNVKAMLVHIKDISKIMRQIMLQEISPKSIYHLYKSINAAKSLYDYFLKEGNEYVIKYLENKISNFCLFLIEIDKVLKFLEDMFEIEECKEIEKIQKIEKSFIKEGVDLELDNKIKTLMDSQDQLESCRSYFNQLIANYESGSKKSYKEVKKGKKKEIDDADDDSKIYVKIDETAKNNYSLLATDRRCKILEELIKNKINVTLKYKSSYSGLDTNFTLSLALEYNRQTASNKSITNQQISTLCKNMSVIKGELIDTVSKVYEKIIKKLQEFQDELTNISELITYIDLIYAKAYIADKYNYCKPEIEPMNDEKSFILATDLRHCLIEKIQQSELYVANDIKIGKGSLENDELDGVLLYGTNAVGKTSFIRALGISVIMAQAGLYVPASSFKYRPYKCIFTRILGNDNIFKGLSTFAVEMSELRTILRQANKNSLVLGDELCSGTESISAVSIFVSGIQTLNKIGCSFIFATHLHEIIGYDEITSLHNVGMKHMSVIYDKEKDRLIYNRKLENGPGTNMYGLEVCKSLSLPEDFLENAHKIRMKYHPESGSVLDQKGSHFNAKHIKGGMCEKCFKNPAIDVHHLIFQNEANDKGIIKKKGFVFNKNNSANLINLCEKCHDDIHKTNKKYKKTKTTIGITLEEIE